MRILVYMRDGRTVYALQRRGDLSALVGVEPWGEHKSLACGRGTWNPTKGEYVWQPVRIRYLAKGSISAVEEGSSPEPPA